MNPDAQKTTHEIFGEVIYAYTRKQAIEDGEQVLLTGEHAELARDAGWKYPVYLTRGVWDLIEQTVTSKTHCHILTGVLWNILLMARFGKDIAEDTRLRSLSQDAAGIVNSSLISRSVPQTWMIQHLQLPLCCRRIDKHS